MKPPFSRSTTTLAVLLAAAALSSCAHSPWKRTLLSSRDGVALFSERRVDENRAPVALGHAHPVSVETEKLESALAALTYTRRRFFRSEESGPVFNADEQKRLSSTLVGALAKAGPDERLRFLVVRETGKFFFARQNGTSGVVFASAPNEIHIAFDMVLENVVIEDGAAGSVSFGADPTTEVPDDFTVQAPRSDGVARLPEATNRIVIDPEVVELPAPRAVATTAPSSEPTSPAPAVSDREPRGTPPTSGNPSATAARVDAAGTRAPAPQADAPAPGAHFAYKGFTVFEHDGRAYAIASSELPVDIGKLGRGEYKTIIERDTIEKIIESIEALRASVR